MAKEKQELSELIRESQGNIAERFDNLDDTTSIVIFETPNEIGIYRAETDSPKTEIARLRTKTSGEAVPQIIASMSKSTFYRKDMMAVLCSSGMKKERPINYYGI